MEFSPTLQQGVLQRRYQRFLADVELTDGRLITAHCPNTGALTGCADPGLPVWLSESDNPRRKYPLTWELVEVAEGVTVGINTQNANRVVGEALRNGAVAGLEGWDYDRSEVKVGASRLDFLLARGGRQLFLEVKNVTSAVDGRVAEFPDAPSERAVRHLAELEALNGDDTQAALVYCVQRDDVDAVRPAAAIDPAYAAALKSAINAGVRVLAFACDVSPQGIRLGRQLAVQGG